MGFLYLQHIFIMSLLIEDKSNSKTKKLTLSSLLYLLFHNLLIYLSTASDLSFFTQTINRQMSELAKPADISNLN